MESYLSEKNSKHRKARDWLTDITTFRLDEQSEWEENQPAGSFPLLESVSTMPINQSTASANILGFRKLEKQWNDLKHRMDVRQV